MRIIEDNVSIEDFKAWSGAKTTQEDIIKYNKVSEFDDLMQELYPDGLTDVTLNDILWHDSSWVYETLGIEEE